MDKNAILARLYSLTGGLKPAPGSTPSELSSLQRTLLEQLAGNPDLPVPGNRIRQEFAQPALSVDPASPFVRLLDQLAAQTGTQTPTAAPLSGAAAACFRQLRSPWGSGLAPSQSFGPFLDEHDLPIWFDFFFPTRLVQIYRQGSATPILLLPLRGLLTASHPTASKRAVGGSLRALSRRLSSSTATTPA